METGVEKEGNAIDAQEIRISSDLLPAAEDRKSPGHSLLTRW
jgi:hypothetical protein